MEQLFGRVLAEVVHYWWLVVIALLVADWFKPKPDVDGAIDEFKPDNTHGASAWADNAALKKAGLFKGDGVRIGYSPDGRHALHYPGAGHLLTVAAARTGKGASLLVNALLSWTGSVIVIDPKAEISSITGDFRRRFGNVYVLNPFRILPDALKKLKQARFNPMDILVDILRTSPQSFGAGCDKLAAGLVWDEGNNEGKHFTTAARILVSGVIAALVRHGAEYEQNLAAVARIVSGDVYGFCRDTVQATTDNFIKDKLGRFALDKGVTPSREMDDVVATARTQLAFISNEAIAPSLSGSSDFRFSDLKRKPGTTIYVCLPLNMMDVSDKYFRLIMECFLWDVLNEGQRGKGKRVLAIVDETYSLGKNMKSLANAFGMAAGAAGVQIWTFWQDLSQVKSSFPDIWETIIQNSGVSLWFGARDQTTRDYVSKLAGATEVLSRSMNASLDPRTGEVMVSGSASQFGRPLLLPHEVGELAPDEMVAFVEGVNGPIKAKRKLYFRCAEFRGKYRDNPYFQKEKGWFRK